MVVLYALTTDQSISAAFFFDAFGPNGRTEAMGAPVFDGGARVPGLIHVLLKIDVGIAHWENTQDRLMALKRLGIS